MTEEQIDIIVNRFLCYRLPQDFNPDCGIAFTPPENDFHWPVGTNLLDSKQAKDMFEQLLDGI